MIEHTEEQNELVEKLKILDKNIKILWMDTGIVSLIDGLITIPITKDIDDSVRHFLMEYSALFGFKKDLSDMKFTTKNYGIDTFHIIYQQFYNGIPVLYAILSALEAPVSGCSTNPARSFAPALVAENFTDHWIYWVAPIIGMVIVSLFFRWRRINRVYKMESARVSYHDHPTSASLKINS